MDEALPMILMNKKSKIRHTAVKGNVLYLFLACTLLTLNVAKAQIKSIQFESGSWEQIKARSANENKLIFLDAYAPWCGICKRMDRNVFTSDTVADYFNTNFINARINMESGEGIEIAKQYNVNAYPTLLFIDGQGTVRHGAVGYLGIHELLNLAADAKKPEKQNPGVTNTFKVDEPDTDHADSENLQIGFNISQVHRDFGLGLRFVSPYFMMKMVAFKVGANLQWFEKNDGTETVLKAYQNFQVGMRSRSHIVSHGVSVYGEGGVFVVLPNNDFSSQSIVVGGYGLFGFEFRMVPGFAYFIELGGVGTGATADKVAGKPIYSNGFLTNVGLRLGF